MSPTHTVQAMPPMPHPLVHHSLQIGTLAMGAACLVALAIIGWQMRRRPAVNNAATRALAVFLAIQSLAATAMLVLPALHLFSPRQGFVATTVLELADAAVLLYACVRAPHALRRADQQLARASASAREYARARQDYEGLMRHRIANPVTIITGAADLLTRPELLTAAQRAELLQAVVDAAGQLERIDLDPHRIGPEEVCFDAVPAVTPMPRTPPAPASRRVSAVV